MTSKKILISIFTLVIFLGLGIGGYIGYSYYNTNVKIPAMERQQDLDHLANNAYDGFFLSTFDPGYTEHDFLTYKAMEILPIHYAPKNFASISDYFAAVDASTNVLSQVYLSFDPLEVWHEAKEDNAAWEALLQDVLTARIAQDSDCTYNILLPYYPISYWESLSEEDFQTASILYQATASRLFSNPNVRIFTYQDLEWLICNEGNYNWEQDKKGNSYLSKEHSLDPEVGETLFLEGLVDGGYELMSTEAAEKAIKNAQLRSQGKNESNEVTEIIYPTVEQMFSNLSDIVSRHAQQGNNYPDLSDTNIVFLGDSIIGNYDNPSGIAKLVAYFTGATSYNCAIGGSCASHIDENSNDDFLTVIDYLLGKKNVPDDKREDFIAAKTMLETPTDKKLIFVIEFGLNDYFLGNRMGSTGGKLTTFKGALSYGIDELKDTFPQATIITIAAGYTGYYNNGNDKCSLKGGSLYEYNQCMRALSEEYGLSCYDLQQDLCFTQDNLYDYSNDGVHYNSNGRYTLSQEFAKYLGNQDL